MKFTRKTVETMSIDQQIQACENIIQELEQLKRSQVTGESKKVSLTGPNIPSLKIDQIEKNLDDNYRQMTLLKIRRMMGY